MAQTIKDIVTWLKQWYYTESEVDDLLDEKQDSLVSGTNIKTINNNSLLGSGNITIQGGGGGGDGSLTKITLADGYDLYVNDNNHLAMLHIHKSVSLSGQWNTLLASAIPSTYRPLGWLGIPDDDNTIIVGDDGGIYYNNFSASSSKTLDNQVNWFFVGGTSSYNVALTSDKSILSYYDSESAVLSATVTDGSNNPVADVTVEFFNGSTSMGTATTNSSGIATKTYASQGSGDVTFTAEANNITDTYTVEDCILANVNKSYTGTSSSDTVYSLGYDEIADLSNINFEMEWTFRETAFGCDVCLGASSEFSVTPIKSNYRVLLGNNAAGAIRYGYRTTTTSASTTGSISRNTDVHMKIVKNGTSFTYYVNNNQVGTKTVSFWTNYNMFGLHTVQWNTGTTTISNLKIKPL